jgi:hypothetical protein
MAACLRIKPSIYTPIGDPLVGDVLLEEQEHCDIYWFHWDKDGVYHVPDYEPVILIYDGNEEICTVIVRRAWNYKPYMKSELTDPLVVGFEIFQHHPKVMLRANIPWFGILFNSVVYEEIGTEYDTRNITSNEIPSMYRKGMSHPSNLRHRIIDDPISKSREYYSEICESM